MKTTTYSDAAVFVVQTPFQLYLALAFKRYWSGNADLWLIDPALRQFSENADLRSSWGEVCYEQVNEKVTGRRRSVSLAFRRLLSLKSVRRRIEKYLKRRKPAYVFLFADNHEVLASFARIAKQRNGARVIMIEEGTAVLFSFKRTEAPFVKKIARYLLGVDNWKGYQIGWSPYIDDIIVSSAALAHKDYLGNRRVLEFPRGPFPPVASEFLEFGAIAVPEFHFDHRDILWLGQPWVEAGEIGIEKENELLRKLSQDDIVRRVIVKAHPFEDKIKYRAFPEIDVLSDKYDSVPAEVLCETSRPMCVVSVFSSTAVNYCVRAGVQSALIMIPEMPAEIRAVAKAIAANWPSIRLFEKADNLLLYLHALGEKRAADSVHVDAAGWKMLVSRIVSGSVESH